MKHIKNCLPNIQKTSFSNKKWKMVLMQQWQKIIGNLSSKVFIHKIYNDAITLGVYDVNWMQELYLLSSVIKNKINQAIDAPRIETVRFKYLAPKANRASNKESCDKLELEEKVLSNKEKKALEKIQDPELVKVLTRLLQKCHHSS